MEFTERNQDKNKVLYDSSEYLEPHSRVSKHEYLHTKHLFQHQVLSWYWIKALEINYANLFSLKVQMEANNIRLDQSDKIHNTNDEIVLNSNEIYNLNPSFHSLSIPYNISNLLSNFPESFLPPHNLGYASNFYSLRKIDSIFSNLDDSNISELFKLFPWFEDVFKKRCLQRTDENNPISTSSSTSKLDFCDKEKLQDASSELVDVSKITNPSENRQKSSRDVNNFQSNSLKSNDYSVDLMKICKYICFPTKLGTNAFEKQKKTSTNEICNIFTKNRQFSKYALCPNYNCSKRFYFANHKTDNSFSCNITEKDDEYCSDIEDNFIEQKLSAKQVTSKIAEIRQKVENLTRGINNELNRREQNHSHFIEECKRICDSTISFYDYDEIYNLKSLQNQSCDEDNMSEHEFLNSSSEEHLRSETLHSNQDLKHDSNFSYFQDSDSFKGLNFPDYYRNQNRSTKFRKQSKVLVPKHSNYLGKVLGNFFHQIAVVLDTISVPFVALLFGKK